MIIILGALTGLLFVIIIVLYLLAGKKYEPTINSFKNEYQLLFMAPVSLFLIEKLKIMETFYGPISKIQQKMISLHGNRTALLHTRMFIAQLISMVLLCLIGTFVFTLVSEGDGMILIVGLFFSLLIPYFFINKLSSDEKERRNLILLELPEVVNKMILLINAGETVQRALLRCVTTTQDPDSPLMVELTETVNRMVSNEPFHQVLNDLSKKCGIQEISIFTTTILLNYRRGGNDLIIALRELSQDLWEKRKSISKTKGEEASSKLVFPLVLIFIAVMIIVGYPAITIM